MLDAILYTVIKRWYVFTFLLAYLGIATYHWGLKRTLKFLVLGYFIAWASEASSIRNGFPYGFYSYHYENLKGEILLMGVPVWDSLSYTFLSFSGWLTATWYRARWNPTTPLSLLHRSWKTILLGALLTMVLDIVIDPVAHLGKQWFLGDIYHYPKPGWYFDVPLSNFGGWFLVALAIISAFRLTDRMEDVPNSIRSLHLGVLLFWGVLLFNLGITLYLRAYALAAASAGWGMLLVLLSRKAKRSSID